MREEREIHVEVAVKLIYWAGCWGPEEEKTQSRLSPGRDKITGRWFRIHCEKTEGVRAAAKPASWREVRIFQKRWHGS